MQFDSAGRVTQLSSSQLSSDVRRQRERLILGAVLIAVVVPRLGLWPRVRVGGRAAPLLDECALQTAHARGVGAAVTRLEHVGADRVRMSSSCARIGSTTSGRAR